MPNYDLSQNAEHTGLWRALPHGSHKKIIKVLLTDPTTHSTLQAFLTSRTNPAQLVDRICRLTGDLAGLVARNTMLPDVPLAVDDDSFSCWRALPIGTESDIVAAIIHDAELTSLMPTITGEYFVNRVSRLCGLAIGQAALTEASSVFTFLTKLVKGHSNKPSPQPA